MSDEPPPMKAQLGLALAAFLIGCGYECDCGPPEERLTLEVTRPGGRVDGFRGTLDLLDFECNGETRNYARYSCVEGRVTFSITPALIELFMESTDTPMLRFSGTLMPEYRITESDCCGGSKTAGLLIVLR